MKKNNKKFHVVVYVENSSPKLKKFKTIKALNAFVDDFQKNHKDYSAGDWIDFTITDIAGNLDVFDEGVEEVK